VTAAETIALLRRCAEEFRDSPRCREDHSWGPSGCKKCRSERLAWDCERAADEHERNQIPSIAEGSPEPAEAGVT